jgi:hypothetical protein
VENAIVKYSSSVNYFLDLDKLVKKSAEISEICPDKKSG